MDPKFMDRLEALRDALAMPIHLNSAYRCPDHNVTVYSTGLRGPHTTGRAVDIALYGEAVVHLVALALERVFRGFGFQQQGPLETRFVPLDNLTLPDYPRPRIWTY
jgi:uncharacterized protein YcbK (DUF882 family)